MSKSNKEVTSRAEKRKQANKKKKKKTALGKKIIYSIIGLILAIGVGGLSLFAYYASNAPKLTIEDLSGSYASDFVDMNGDVFYTLGGEKREYAEADEYPQVMLDAIKAIEDTRFDRHIGIDPIGISRAALGYLTNAGEIVGGGSTITQQLVKLAVFSTAKEDQTLERKAQEAWLAIQVERQLSKEQIMTLYLNRIHMGSNVYGVATAAQEYYGKHVSDLELHEAAMFAAMPKAPNFYNPYMEPEEAKKRRDLVLDEMVEYGAITQETADATKEIPVEEGLLERTEDETQLVFDAYMSAVIDELTEKTEYDPYTAGLTVYTNYDPEAQKLLYDVVNSDEYVQFPNDELQTAMTLVDSSTGRLTALIGGRKLEGQRLLNRATKNARSVASTIKPLTTYGPAIEFNQFSTYHQVVDEPYTLGDWSPRNYDRTYKGQMSMREALVDSRNIPAAKIFNEDLDHNQVEGFLQGLGIDVATLSGEGGEGLVRSSSINGTMTPLELTGAYAAFANEGNYTEPYAVTKIVTQRGEEMDLTPSTTKAMEDYTAYMVTDMLKGIVPHYGNQLSIPGYIHAAKTGTSNYSEAEIAEHGIPAGAVPDNWVVGYSPYYTMSVWMGYDQKFETGNQLKSSDGSIRLSRAVYKAAMSRLVQNLEQKDWQRPSSVVELSVEKGSMPAKLAPKNSSNAVSELFVKGSSEIPSETAAPEFVLTAPTGLTGAYDAEADAVTINWDAYAVPDDVKEKVEYILTINGQSQTLSATQYVLSSPSKGNLDISLAVRVGGDTGPAAQLQIIIPDPNDVEEPEEPPVEEQPEENEDENEEPSEPVEDNPDNPGNSNNSEEPNNSNNSNNSE